MARTGAWFRPRETYSRAERISDAAVHLVALATALAAVPALIVLAVVQRGDPSAVAGTAIYGAALILMITFSGLYNAFGHRRWGAVLRRLDHSAIYVKIAGTYTPFLLLSGQGIYLLAGLWAAALAGVGLKAVSPDRLRWLGLGLYLAMGWVGLLAGGAFLAALSPPVFVLIVTGGVIYTVGVLFYLCAALPFHNTFWHVFVMTASSVFCAAVTLQAMAVPA